MYKDGGCKKVCVSFLLLKAHEDSEEGKKSWFVRSANYSSGVLAEGSCPKNPWRKQRGAVLCMGRKHLCRFGEMREMRWGRKQLSWLQKWEGCQAARHGFHPSQPSPDSSHQEPAAAYSKQELRTQHPPRKSTTKLWCVKHYGWWNLHFTEGNAKLPLISMEQVFFPSHCLSDQISVPSVTHSLSNIFRGN